MTVNMPRGSICVTRRCNLKCKLCGVYAPYYERPHHPTLEYLYQSIDRYFGIVDYVQEFSLAGGEVLLRKDLPQLIQRVRQYEKKIGRLGVVTNGTIIPSDELIDELKKFKIRLYLLVDDYGPDKSVNALAAYKKFQEVKGAEIVLRDYHSADMYFSGWVDFGISENTAQKSPEESKKVFTKCAYPQKLDFCSSMMNGKIYSCAQLRRAIELGLVAPDPSEVFDLFDSSQSDSSIKERINALYNKDVLSACAYCNGLCDDSIRYQPAEQLTKEEQELLWK